MTDKHNGGPAFPIEFTATPYAPGMSLRDWFAGQALSGLLPICVHDTIGPGGFAKHIAKHAHDIADAMLAARVQE